VKFKSQEICDLFDISKATLFRWEDAGHFPEPARSWRGGPAGNRDWRLKDVRAIFDSLNDVGQEAFLIRLNTSLRNYQAKIDKILRTVSK
jgi:hypothetical protein